MIEIIEEQFPSDIAMNILKFCRHPTAQMIKDSHKGHVIVYKNKKGRESWMFLNQSDEEYWNNLIGDIKDRKQFREDLKNGVYSFEDQDEICWW